MLIKKITENLFHTLPAREKRITLANLITILRIVLIPFIIGSMIAHYWKLACLFFIAAALTDVIDGKVARWRNEHTFLGALLDPLADKFLVLSCFFTLAFIQTPLFALPPWFFIIVLCKELLLVMGGYYIYITRGHVHIQPTPLGKATTLLQLSFIFWMFLCFFFHWSPMQTYQLVLGVMVCAIMGCAVQYSYAGYKQLTQS